MRVSLLRSAGVMLRPPLSIKISLDIIVLAAASPASAVIEMAPGPYRLIDLGVQRTS